MRLFIPVLAVVATLAACGGGGGAEEGTKVFKSMGALQCGSPGLSLAALQAQLAAANVQVRSAACGTDGRPVAAVCGAPDTRIGIFEIAPAQAGLAATAGFTLLSTLPAAKTVSCT